VGALQEESVNLSLAAPFIGPAVIIALLAVPIRWHAHLHGWRLNVWAMAMAVIILAVLVPLVPDLDSARPLLATVSVCVGLPVCVALAVGIAERWTWRRTVPLAVALGLCGVLHLLAPAYADEGAAVSVVPVASPLVPPELVGLPVPSWLTTLLAGAALARYLTTMLAKGVKVTVELVHTFDPAAPRVEIHHAGAMPPPDHDPADEHSGVRRGVQPGRRG
jgi:hypothetical protein